MLPGLFCKLLILICYFCFVKFSMCGLFFDKFIRYEVNLYVSDFINGYQNLERVQFMIKRNVKLGMLLATLAFNLVGGSACASLSTEQKLQDFNEMVRIVERNYGPFLWKKTSIKLDWKKHVETFRARVAATKSDREIPAVFGAFLAGLHDAHVTGLAPSTYSSKLGFLCDYIDGKVLIETIDTLALPEILFPFKKGDQLISLGGVPVEKLITDLIAQRSTGNLPTDLRLGAAWLTNRKETTGLPVARGVTTVTILPKGAAQAVTVTATWINKGKPLVEMDNLDGIDGANAHLVLGSSELKSGKSLMDKIKGLSLFNAGLPETMRKEFKEMGIGDIGNVKSMFPLPEGAKDLELGITAAIYESGGKKIGILRVPEFSSENGLVDAIASAVVQMEASTDVLVLDQTNNPGGDVSVASLLTSIFADKSYKDMAFEVRASVGWLKEMQDINKQIEDMLKADANDVGANALKARFDYLESEFYDAISHKKFSTDPISLDFVGAYGFVQPQPTVRYTKPILMLINEFDFSGGDAFPAILKDNGRVTLFGMRTSGAGGNVKEYGPLANTAYKFSLTESLMVRPNGQYVENLGVSPDIVYPMNEDDFMNNYSNYVKAFTKAALDLVK